MSGDKDIFILHLQEGPFHFRDLFLASRETESLLPWLFLSTYLFINLFLVVPVFGAAHRISPAVLVSGGGLPLRPAAQLQSAGSRHACSVLVSMGLVAPQHVESSRTRDQTHVSCIGRWILYL